MARIPQSQRKLLWQQRLERYGQISLAADGCQILRARTNLGGFIQSVETAPGNSKRYRCEATSGRTVKAQAEEK